MIQRLGSFIQRLVYLMQYVLEHSNRIKFIEVIVSIQNNKSDLHGPLTEESITET